ncbi:MAG: zinc ribbon domain-containing protein [Promethearchaeota archaeon]
MSSRKIYNYLSEMRFVIPICSILILISLIILGILNLWLIILFNVLIASVTLLFWWVFSPKIIKPINRFLTKNFLGKKLVGGSEYYLELDTAKVWFPLSEIFIRIAFLLTSWIGTALFVINLLNSLGVDILSITQTNWDLSSITALTMVLFLALISIIPFFLIILVPTCWCLYDVRLKAWDKKKRLNWLISKKFLLNFSFITSAGAIASTIFRLAFNENISLLNLGPAINVFSFLATAFLVTFFSAILITTFYILILYRPLRKSLLSEVLDFPPALSTIVYLEEMEEEDFARLLYKTKKIPTEGIAERKPAIEGLEEEVIGESTPPPMENIPYTPPIAKNNVQTSKKPSRLSQIKPATIKKSIDDTLEDLKERSKTVTSTLSKSETLQDLKERSKTVTSTLSGNLDSLFQRVLGRGQTSSSRPSRTLISCPQCSSKIGSDSSYCPFCGTTL